MKTKNDAITGADVLGRKILVTGAAGLIGRAVVEILVARGADLTLLDVSYGDEPVHAHAGCTRLLGSISDAAVVEEAVRAKDAVVHLAGLAGLDRGSPAEIYEANALGTFLVMDAAGRAGVGKVVYASSINASGLPLNPLPVLPSRYPWDEDEPADIADAYSLSKQANEAAAQETARRYGIELTGLRFPLVRDIASDQGRSFAQHVRSALKLDPRRQACEGWTYLDVRDAAEATFAALTHSTPPAPGILVANRRTYLRQDTEQWLQKFAADVPRETVEGRDAPVSLHRAESALSFTASISLEDFGEHLLVDLGKVTP